MIALYESIETNFNHNGIGILSESISCMVERELNGLWSLELEYPLFDKKKLSLELNEDKIIKAPTPSGTQLFRIMTAEKTFSRIRVYAVHLFYDLIRNFIVDTNIVGKNRLEAVQQLLSNTMTPHNFNVIGSTTTYQDIARVVRKNPVEAIFGSDDNTILNRWGGEFDFDNHNIIVKDQIGQDNGVLIAYKKNLTGITENLDYTNVATRIVPQGFNEILLPEYYSDSPKIDLYYQPFIKHIKMEGIKVRDESGDGTADTEAEAQQQLRDACNKLYSEGIDVPFFNYRVSFIQLSKTEEYKNYKILEDVNIGDTVIVRHLGIGIDLKGRVIKYKYNSLLLKYDDIEIGLKKSNISSTINTVAQQVEFTKQKIEIGLTSLDQKMAAKILVTEQNINLSVDNKIAGVNSSLDITAGQIRGETSQSINNLSIEIDGELVTINNRLSSAELKITPTAITSTVRQSTEYNTDLNNTVNTAKGYTDGQISPLATDMTNVKSRLDSAELKITPSAITSTVRQSTEYTVDMNNKANQSSLNTTNSNVSGLTTRVSNAESSITQQAGQIALKVSADDVHSLIQQTPTDVQISFNKIASAKVTIDINGLTVTNGTINSPVINGGTFNGDEFLVNAHIGVKPPFSNFGLGAGEIRFYRNATTYDVMKIGADSTGYGTWLGVNNGLRVKGTLSCTMIQCDAPPWATSSHSHSGVYADYYHSHSNYSLTSHNHDSNYSNINHQHNGASIYPYYINCSGTFDGHSIFGTWLYSTGNCNVEGNLVVGGTKNCVQVTENYGKRLINAYETAESYFGDLGESIIGDKGYVIIPIEETFKECVNTTLPYHVFASVYNGSINVIERYDNCFIVHGLPGTEFSWEMKAKRKGYENIRLVEYKED